MFTAVTWLGSRMALIHEVARLEAAPQQQIKQQIVMSGTSKF
jgi:hypothetical protein